MAIVKNNKKLLECLMFSVNLTKLVELTQHYETYLYLTKIWASYWYNKYLDVWMATTSMSQELFTSTTSNKS